MDVPLAESKSVDTDRRAPSRSMIASLAQVGLFTCLPKLLSIFDSFKIQNIQIYQILLIFTSIISLIKSQLANTVLCTSARDHAIRRGKIDIVKKLKHHNITIS